MSKEYFGVYLLYSVNPLFRGRVYIGFTVNPTRRISQHNRGTKYGGAYRTNNRGPWEMLFIVCGFPNEIAALRFEWAWQHPLQSRRLNQLPKRKTGETLLNYHLRLLDAMISRPPWIHLPLDIQIMNDDIISDLGIHLPRKPEHIDIVPLSMADLSDETSENTYEVTACELCCTDAPDSELTSCYHDQCNFSAHLVCLASSFLKNSDQILPVSGQCPTCDRLLKWGKLVKYRIQI